MKQFLDLGDTGVITKADKMYKLKQQKAQILSTQKQQIRGQT
jgi:hypothetical protein